MKRSKSVNLVLMSLGAVAVAGCGESQEQVFVYQNPEQCVADKRGTERECNDALIKAKAAHLDKAPRYEDKADCERDFGVGKCEERTDSASLTRHSQFSTSDHRPRSNFVPMMVGYMMGQRNSLNPPQPLYRFKNTADYRTPGGGTVPGGAASGSRLAPSSVAAPVSRPVTIPRGGFGTTAMSKSFSSST